jgi:hypothetical protein
MDFLDKTNWSHAVGLATLNESNEALTHMIEKPRREEAVSA